MDHYDVIITGGGINGCFCGALLAKRGLKVLVVERNRYLGGDVATQEITLPGFKHEMGGVIIIHCLNISRRLDKCLFGILTPHCSFMAYPPLLY